MELTYRTEGDYLVPNLTFKEKQPRTLGKYACLRKEYLKQHKKVMYINLLTAGTLAEHLNEIEQTATERIEIITKAMAKADGVTEKLKANDPIKGDFYDKIDIRKIDSGGRYVRR